MLAHKRLTRPHLQRGAALALLAVAALLAAFLVQNGQPGPAYAQDACTLPGEAQNFSATAGHAKLTLTWDAPASWGGWDGEGRRYYVLRWRQENSGWDWNVIGSSINRNPPTDAYTFSGTYREVRGSNPDGDHTVTNGTAYEFQIQAVYSTYDCATVGGYDEETSGSPVASQETLSDDATLSGLELDNATFGSDRSEAPVGLGKDVTFASDFTEYYALVLKEIDRVTVKPTATAGNDATIRVWLKDGPRGHNVASGSSSSAIEIAPKSDNTVPHEINVRVTAEDGVTTKIYRIRVWQLDPITFGDAAIDDMNLTAGAAAPGGDSAIVLPEIAAGLHNTFTSVTYTAAGLPAGLTFGSNDRVIGGTPQAATTGPVTVTYTAEAAETGSSASLTFQVTVAPSVAFDAAQLAAFNDTALLIEYTIGQTGRINVTLPSASGGHGGLTYNLVYLDEVEETVVVDGVPQTNTAKVERSVNDEAPGFSFDAATRVLTSDTGGSEPAATAFYSLKYSAVDANGGSAVVKSHLAVRDAPSLPEITDQSLTVGVEASITLPDASGGSLGGLTSLDYTLEGEVEGLTFRAYDPITLQWDRKLVGTPEFAGSAEMTYTVTDANGVSDSKTFTVTVVNGPTAPSSAPASLTAGHVTGSTAAARWDAVTGATSYVVQVIAADGSFPDKPLDSMPDGVALSFRAEFPTQAVFSAIGAGDYKVRVAARNDDGVGPWSAEASFTVNVGGV